MAPATTPFSKINGYQNAAFREIKDKSLVQSGVDLELYGGLRELYRDKRKKREKKHG